MQPKLVPPLASGYKLIDIPEPLRRSATTRLLIRTVAFTVARTCGWHPPTGRPHVPAVAFLPYPTTDQAVATCWLLGGSNLKDHIRGQLSRAGGDPKAIGNPDARSRIISKDKARTAALCAYFKTCTTDIYLHNECAHVGLSRMSSLSPAADSYGLLLLAVTCCCRHRRRHGPVRRRCCYCCWHCRCGCC